MPRKPASHGNTDETVIRMYRQGLGDCFLITFQDETSDPVHMLIDCGVWDNDSETLARMKRVVEDIMTTTSGHLHLLVCTHEHWDHNSGFLQEQPVFDQMTIDNVWLAWTEDPSNSQAAKLKVEFEEKRRRLALATQQLHGVNPSLARTVENLMHAADLGMRADPSGAMRWVRERSKTGSRIEYCTPGNVLPIPGGAAATAFVLGPPTLEKLLRKNLATKKETEAGEVYELALANSFADNAFFAAAERSDKSAAGLGPLTMDQREEHALSMPFDAIHQIPATSSGAIKLLAESYDDFDQDWRRIDDDWMNTAAQIALWMDSSTNNTSLSLAIELQPSKKVLLFVGDAQVGNWKSWQSLKFQSPQDHLTMDDLLRRTVLYKVGHHGSHNATLRKEGLEKMTSEDLAAMIPVNRASVEKKKWKMPAAGMYQDLVRATQGRIIRADEGLAPKPDNAPSNVYKAFQRRCRTTPLYIELRIPG